jgi:adenosylcobinamide kinase/adenosylcobinamide-phosphate guanylyltransferase
MAEIILVVGGCRSGKSAYARALAESLSPSRGYLATCPVIDEEMHQRVELHQAARRDRGWETVEEQCDLAGAIARCGRHGVLLVECVTLWINNLMHAAESEGHQLDETQVAERCREVLAAAAAAEATVVFVSNEVGMGIVPENAAARRYRDLVGRANQLIAARAAQMTLTCCGIPMHLKTSPRIG